MILIRCLLKFAVDELVRQRIFDSEFKETANERQAFAFVF